PIVDRHYRKFALVHSMPRLEDDWKESVMQPMVDDIEEGMSCLKFSGKNRYHKRGPWGVALSGQGFGGGRQARIFIRAGNIAQPKKTRSFVRRLFRRPAWNRWSRFVNSIFKTHFPEMYKEYKEMMDDLAGSDESLVPNFDGSVFAAVAINFTDNAASEPHTDEANRPDGLCTITGLGPYDHTKGGHIVLLEAKLVIEFPSGSTVFIPSAISTHYNMPVQKGDKRYSVTQFTGGGLFRWVKNGFMSDKSWYAQASPSDRLKRQEENGTRWYNGLRLFPIIPNTSAKV
ncbi:hypothetical protein CYLTODRAFT_362185, partial [Cylindrobasidium torrendii FP15055 ss-10]